jgi:hypothetical protein
MVRLAILLTLCVLASCKEISFREPQPRGKKSLTTVPKNLQGKYMAVKDDGEFTKDTIVIYEKGYRFGYFDPKDKGSDKYENGVLGDSLVLKSFKGYYFLNFNERPEWNLRVLTLDKNGDLIYMGPEQEQVDFDEYIKKLSADVKVDSFTIDGEMLYQIDPSPGELVKLIEKGYYSRMVLKKVK